MLTESTAILRAMGKIALIFGNDYIIEHKNCPMSKQRENNNIKVSVFFESSKQRPDLEPNHLGWCVFATVNVNLETGEATLYDYILPNGERMNNN